MAAGERSGGSDRRFAQRRSPLLLLLLPVRPALGNEGGAAGSCQCEKFSTEPALVRRFPDRLVAWERCRGLIRFIFPKNLVCGLDDAPWVLRLISRKRDMRKGSAKVSSSERSSQPSPTSRAPLQPLSSMGSTPPVVPRETLPSQRLPALTHTTAAPALESVWSAVPPRNAGAIAEVSPTRFGQEEGVPGWHQTAVLSALGIVLLLVIVGLLCWWRPPRRGCQAALTSEQQGPTCALQRRPDLALQLLQQPQPLVGQAQAVGAPSRRPRRRHPLRACVLRGLEKAGLQVPASVAAGGHAARGLAGARAGGAAGAGGALARVAAAAGATRAAPGAAGGATAGWRRLGAPRGSGRPPGAAAARGRRVTSAGRPPGGASAERRGREPRAARQVGLPGPGFGGAHPTAPGGRVPRLELRPGERRAAHGAGPGPGPSAGGPGGKAGPGGPLAGREGAGGHAGQPGHRAGGEVPEEGEPSAGEAGPGEEPGWAVSFLCGNPPLLRALGEKTGQVWIQMKGAAAASAPPPRKQRQRWLEQEGTLHWNPIRITFPGKAGLRLEGQLLGAS